MVDANLIRKYELAGIVNSAIYNTFIAHANLENIKKDKAATIGCGYFFYGFRRTIWFGAIDQLCWTARGAADIIDNPFDVGRARDIDCAGVEQHDAGRGRLLQVG